MEFVLEGPGGLGQQPPPGRRQFDEMRAPVTRVGDPAAEAGGLDTVDKLAGAAGRDRQLFGDVEDAARRVPGHHLHRLEPRELQVMLGPKARVHGIPHISLEADQLVEYRLQIGHDP